MIRTESDHLVGHPHVFVDVQIWRHLLRHVPGRAAGHSGSDAHTGNRIAAKRKHRYRDSTIKKRGKPSKIHTPCFQASIDIH